MASKSGYNGNWWGIILMVSCNEIAAGFWDPASSQSKYCVIIINTGMHYHHVLLGQYGSCFFACFFGVLQHCHPRRPVIVVLLLLLIIIMFGLWSFIVIMIILNIIDITSMPHVPMQGAPQPVFAPATRLELKALRCSSGCL